MSHVTFEATEQNFGTQVLESALPVLIEFTADWCPPCKMLAPIIHEIAGKYEGKLRVGLLDSDNNQAVVQQYGVMGLPTMILFVDGQPTERIVGYTARERIEAKLLPHLAMQQA
ncbi:MAG TPA: thioredoxin domain-containing protein [Phototrophicaceae bacterium]|jgi:thioredoxin 1|nr:thioredoxin domain-containing protein [Phototrophicaceae bacterium]